MRRSRKRIEKPPLEDENDCSARAGRDSRATAQTAQSAQRRLLLSYRTCPECGKYMLEGLSPADAAKQRGEFVRCPACSNPVFPADEVNPPSKRRSSTQTGRSIPRLSFCLPLRPHAKDTGKRPLHSTFTYWSGNRVPLGELERAILLIVQFGMRVDSQRVVDGRDNEGRAAVSR